MIGLLNDSQFNLIFKGGGGGGRELVRKKLKIFIIKRIYGRKYDN